jgi:hypothetical protein
VTTAHAIVVSAVLLTPDPPSWRTSMVQVDSDRDSSVATTSIVADPVDLPAVMQVRLGVEQNPDEQYATGPRPSPSPDDVGTTPDLPCKLVSKRKSTQLRQIVRSPTRKSPRGQPIVYLAILHEGSVNRGTEDDRPH